MEITIEKVNTQVEKPMSGKLEVDRYTITQTEVVTKVQTVTMQELEAEKKMHQAVISAEESAIAEIDRKLEIIGNLEQ